MNIAANFQTNRVNAYQEIYEQYVDNASFLWVLRSIAVHQPHYNIDDVLELEQRIEAQLDGLMTSIETAWPLCEQALELEEPGEVFTAAIVAFRSHDANKIQRVVEAGLGKPQTVKGLISALGWLPGKLVHDWIRKFFTSKNLDHKYLAIAACSVRRENPEAYLNRILDREDCRNHHQLYSRCLRLIGEIRRLDLMPHLEQARQADDVELKFYAHWSSILLGDRSSVSNLQPYVLKQGSFQVKAINLVFRCLPLEQARTLISKLAEVKSQSRNVIRASGVLGDPHAINWLISRMQDKDAAKLAGEAFSLITGIDFNEYDLKDEQSVSGEEHPNEAPDDEDVSLDEDENLPMPDYEKVKTYWINHAKNFVSGQRYFLGKPINTEYIQSCLPLVNQRQRHAAALELALTGETTLINTCSRVML